jgi:hypothetical protein
MESQCRPHIIGVVPNSFFQEKFADREHLDLGHDLGSNEENLGFGAFLMPIIGKVPVLARSNDGLLSQSSITEAKNILRSLSDLHLYCSHGDARLANVLQVEENERTTYKRIDFLEPTRTVVRNRRNGMMLKHSSRV